jgi:AraC family transcriptional regulator
VSRLKRLLNKGLRQKFQRRGLSTMVQHVPITMGSPAFRSLELDDFRVTEAWFPAGEVLQRHNHDRACVAVMLEGAFELRFTGKSFACPPTAVFTEPAGEMHANHMGTEGAHVVVVQPDPARDELVRPFAALLDRTTHRQDPGVANQASRLARELDRADDLSVLAAEGIVLDMLVGLARLDIGGGHQPPRWLLQAQELVHDQFAEPLRVTQIASAVGVHPAHLARGFRTYFRLSIGSYIRRLRLDWAARELARDTPLARVALAAGFADQSHFTRFFKRYTGLTPNAYRQTMRD